MNPPRKPYRATHRPHALLEGAGAVEPRPLLGSIDIAVLIVEGLSGAMKVHLHRWDEAPIGRLLEKAKKIGRFEGVVFVVSNVQNPNKKARDLPIYLWKLGKTKKTNHHSQDASAIYTV